MLSKIYTMKKISYFICLTISFFILKSSSCSHDSTDVNPSNSTSTQTPSTPSNTIPGAGWHVSLFSEISENKTSHFTGYTFDFATSGTVTATKGSQSVSGTWKQYQNDGITKFAIILNTTDKDLSDLNDDWALVSKSDNLISLKNDNSSKNEQLQFSK
jgi:hypothetical protein